MSTCTSLRLASLVTSLDQLGAPSPPSSPDLRRASMLRRTTSTFSTFHAFTPVQKPSSRSTSLQQALQALPANPTAAELGAALRALKSAGPATGTRRDYFSATAQGDERLLEWTLLARVVLAKYGMRVNELVKSAGDWEDEIDWWKRLDSAGRWAWGGIGGYFVQTFPHRLIGASVGLYQSRDTFSYRSLTPTHLLSSLFPTTPIPRSAQYFFNPKVVLRMTRLEVRARIAELEAGRDARVKKLGKVIVEAPSFGDADGELDAERLGKELGRIIVLLHESQGDHEADDVQGGLPVEIHSTAEPQSLLPHLERLLTAPVPPSQPPAHLTRPRTATRLWPFLVLLPLVIRQAASYLPALQASIGDAREMIHGFWQGWVVEPALGIIDTVRHGGGEDAGKGLSVISKDGMKSDMDSLERMVVSLAQDKKSYTPQELDVLASRVKKGDLSDVLRLYEDDIKSPLKSAISGSLIRSLLIQIQKTKVDVDLALSGIDHLLRSQELTFAFVGVAPSLLVLYLFSGWVRAFLSSAGGLALGGRSRAEGRRRSWESIRRIERILLLADKQSTAPITSHGPSAIQADVPFETQGLLLVSIASLRDVAKREFKRREATRKAEYLQDLLDLENPEIGRKSKLATVERMWRSWGPRLLWTGRTP